MTIGDGTVLGFRGAHLLGDGEILLQARAPSAAISIGSNCHFNNNVAICAMESIVMGDRCLIGDQVTIYDCDFHEISPATRNRSPGPSKPVTIGRNVWLGSRVIVLKGVTIGDNAVIGAMSLVARDAPSNCIAAGNPARVIRVIGLEEQTNPDLKQEQAPPPACPDVQ